MWRFSVRWSSGVMAMLIAAEDQTVKTVELNVNCRYISISLIEGSAGVNE